MDIYKIFHKIEEFKIANGTLMKLTRDGKSFTKISNFYPIVKRKIRLTNSKKSKIIMFFDGEAQTSDFIIFSDNLEKIKENYPFEGVIFPNARGFDKDIIFLIKKMLIDMPEEFVYEIDKTGWTELSGIKSYFHGGGYFSSVNFLDKGLNVEISNDIKDKIKVNPFVKTNFLKF